MGTYNKSSKKQVKRYKRSYRKKIKKSKKKTRKSVKRIKRSHLRNSKKKLKGNKQKGGGVKKKINLLCKIPIATLKYIFEQMLTNPDQWEYISEQVKNNPQIIDKNLRTIRLLLELNRDEISGVETALTDSFLSSEYKELITSAIKGTRLPSVAGAQASDGLDKPAPHVPSTHALPDDPVASLLNGAGASWLVKAFKDRGFDEVGSIKKNFTDVLHQLEKEGIIPTADQQKRLREKLGLVSTEVAALLKKSKLEHYAERFHDEGFDDLDVIKMYVGDVLQEIEMLPDEQERLRRALAHPAGVVGRKEPLASALRTVPDPSKCIQCKTNDKRGRSHFCSDICKATYLDRNLECLTCNQRPMGILSPDGERYNIESLFCRACRGQQKDIEWKRSVNSIGGMYNGTPAITILENKGWLPHIAGGVKFAVDRYYTWMKS